jgi:hypothetical protein
VQLSQSNSARRRVGDKLFDRSYAFLGPRASSAHSNPPLRHRRASVQDAKVGQKHLSLDRDTPIPRAVAPPGHGVVVAIPEVGGLHHRYVRRAAQRASRSGRPVSRHARPRARRTLV